jgi:phosphoribosylformylglycinamidine synthase
MRHGKSSQPCLGCRTSPCCPFITNFTARSSFEQVVEGSSGDQLRGYHKPVMIAGGMGNIRPMLVDKYKIPAGSLIIILGGPAMLIGLGGSAASSQASGESAAELD